MKLEDRGLIFDATHQPARERVAAFVSLYRLASGSLLCGFQLGPRKQGVAPTVRFCRSTDDGVHWHAAAASFETSMDGIPGSLVSGEVVELPSGTLLLYATWFDRSDPQRPLFDPETQGILHSKQLIAESTDEGETWSDWRELSIPRLRGCSSTGPILRWPDGRIAIALESYKEYGGPAPATHGAWMLGNRSRVLKKCLLARICGCYSDDERGVGLFSW